MNEFRARILLIEDDKILSSNIKTLLTKNNYNVISTVSGIEGLKIAYKDSLNLVLCDIMLPDIDGYTVLEKLKKNRKTKTLSFIFLTAKIEMHYIRKGMNLGADDYLTKPFKIIDLLNAIEVRLKKNKLFRLEYAKEPVRKIDINYTEYIFLDTGKTISNVKIDKIVCMLSVGNYSFLYTTDGKKYTLRKLLKEWEAILPGNYFIRIHRSAIINITYIKKIQKSFNNTFNVYLHHFKEPLIISRRYGRKVKNYIIT